MITTTLTPYARLPRPYRALHIVSSTVDAFGRAHWLLTERPPDRRHARPYDAVVVTVDGGAGHQETELSSVTPQFPCIDALPDGGFVLADRRCGKDEEHVQVFDALGRPSWTFRVGDGIGHLLADEAGHLWVGYFDEGVYGGDELSRPGLRRFDATGQPLWTYHPADGGGTISDCYALNVAGETAWACAYTSFTLLEIRPGHGVTPYANKVAGARGLAVQDGRVAFFGGYRDDRDRLVRAEAANGTVEPVAQERLVRPDGRALGRCRVIGRGPRLYVQEKPFTEWAVLDLAV
ncbi:hypothetical protein ACWCP6_32285 [Streptomyces sp. NPDC002004]